jgi:hypothetical protein
MEAYNVTVQSSYVQTLAVQFNTWTAKDTAHVAASLEPSPVLPCCLDASGYNGAG